VLLVQEFVADATETWLLFYGAQFLVAFVKVFAAQTELLVHFEAYGVSDY
jgi:hypothetical protein